MGRSQGRKWPKMAKNSISLHISGTNCTSYDCVFWYTIVKWRYLQQFFSFFQKSNFSGFSKFINDWQKEILRCAPSFFTCMWFYMCVIFVCMAIWWILCIYISMSDRMNEGLAVLWKDLKWLPSTVYMRWPCLMCVTGPEWISWVVPF